MTEDGNPITGALLASDKMSFVKLINRDAGKVRNFHALSVLHFEQMTGELRDVIANYIYFCRPFLKVCNSCIR